MYIACTMYPLLTLISTNGLCQPFIFKYGDPPYPFVEDKYIWFAVDCTRLHKYLTGLIIEKKNMLANQRYIGLSIEYIFLFKIEEQCFLRMSLMPHPCWKDSKVHTQDNREIENFCSFIFFTAWKELSDFSVIWGKITKSYFLYPMWVLSTINPQIN